VLASIIYSHAFIVVLGNTEPHYPDKHFAFESSNKSNPRTANIPDFAVLDPDAHWRGICQVGHFNCTDRAV
ncbi:MAG TPA: hypothetical protein VFG54_11720, partial [Prolixibacteraceae bacterium]|nr:hypothetical protein [Prolixibacteraceae bacterium]